MYDRLGRLTQRLDSGVADLTFCYDGYDQACGFSNSARSAGRLTCVHDKSGYVTYTYDSAGRLKKESRLFNNSIGARDTNYVLDDNGNRTTVMPPAGPGIVRTFNEADRETLLQWTYGGPTPSTGDIATSIAWYPMGGLKPPVSG